MKNIKLPHKHGYPGDGYYYIICDVCGRKIRAKDATLIRDKFNTLNNMLVCKHDVDETNPQVHLKSVKEKHIRNPKYIRSEGPDIYQYINTDSEIETGDLTNPSGRVPESPNLNAALPESTSVIALRWSMTEPFRNPGSTAIKGYKIERESPEGGGFSTIVSLAQGSYYEDTGLTSGTEYNYRVSAVNENGTSDPSSTKKTTTE